MMFISGIVVALAIEHCGLHKRIALNCILLFGTSPKKYFEYLETILKSAHSQSTSPSG